MARVLLVGLDGFDHGMFESMAARGSLPRLQELGGRGAAWLLRSPPPSATISSWTTILTGLNPGRHGLFDFMQRDGYRLRFTGALRREAPSILEILSTAGRRVVSAGFPGTFPPVDVNGIVLAGWDSPVAIRGRRAGCSPAHLHDELVRRFGEDYLPFDVLNQFRAGTDAGPGWYRDATSRMRETIGRRVELLTFLVERAGGDPDLVAVHFPEADTAGHHFWHLHDLNSPRRPPWIGQLVDEETGGLADPLAEVYAALDRAVGELVDRLRPGCVAIVSDHGMGGSGTRLASINRLLAREGFLNLEREIGRTGDLLGTVQRLGLELVPPDLRQELLGPVGSTVAAEIVSRVRFGGMDWPRTAAFSEDLNYAPSIHMNEMGRDPAGTIHRSERTWWLKLVVDALEGWEADTPEGVVPPGRSRVVERVHLREDLFRGPHLDRMPALVLELARDAGYTLNLHPGRFRSMREPVERLPDDLLQGSKGRSMPGSHRPEGVFILASTDGIALSASEAGQVVQESVTPLILEIAGLRVPGHFDSEPGRVTDSKLEWLDGRTLAEAWDGARRKAGEARRPSDEEGDRAVKQRLEDLGYF